MILILKNICNMCNANFCWRISDSHLYINYSFCVISAFEIEKWFHFKIIILLRAQLLSDLWSLPSLNLLAPSCLTWKRNWKVSTTIWPDVSSASANAASGVSRTSWGSSTETLSSSARSKAPTSAPQPKRVSICKLSA